MERYRIVEYIDAHQFIAKFKYDVQNIFYLITKHRIYEDDPRATRRMEAIMFLKERKLIHCEECFYHYSYNKNNTIQKKYFCTVEKLTGYTSLRKMIFERKDNFPLEESLVAVITKVCVQTVYTLHAIEQSFGPLLSPRSIVIDTKSKQAYLRPFMLRFDKYLKRYKTHYVDAYTFDARTQTALEFDESLHWYWSPEILLHHSSTSLQFSFENDVWSLGCIFCELLLPYPIFRSSSLEKQIQQIHSLVGSIRPSPPGSTFRGVDHSECIKNLKKLLHSTKTVQTFIQAIGWCFIWNPRERATASFLSTYSLFSAKNPVFYAKHVDDVVENISEVSSQTSIKSDDAQDEKQALIDETLSIISMINQSQHNELRRKSIGELNRLTVEPRYDTLEKLEKAVERLEKPNNYTTFQRPILQEPSPSQPMEKGEYNSSSGKAKYKEDLQKVTELLNDVKFELKKIKEASFQMLKQQQQQSEVTSNQRVLSVNSISDDSSFSFSSLDL